MGFSAPECLLRVDTAQRSLEKRLIAVKIRAPKSLEARGKINELSGSRVFQDTDRADHLQP
jgi:hypothetical protein